MSALEPEIPRKPRVSLAWFAGTDLSALARSPSERRFYTLLGSAVFALTTLSAFAFTVTVGFLVGKPLTTVWPAGLVWFALMAFAIEPLIYQTVTGRVWSLPLIVVPRLALCLVLAIQVGEPLLLWINSDRINAYLATNNSAQVQNAQAATNAHYGSVIAADEKQIAGIRAREQTLRGEIARATFLAQCEQGTPSCSHHGAGRGPYYYRDQADAQNAKAQLDEIAPGDQATIASLQASITRLRNEETSQDNRQQSAILADTGLLARESALGALERSDSSVAREVWYVRIFFIVLDLLPLTMKVTRMLIIRSPYEEMMRADREGDAAEAYRLRQRARVARHEAEVEADADIAIASERSRARAMGAINEVWERFRGPIIRRMPRSRRPGEPRSM